MCTPKFLQRHAITHIQTLLHAFLHREFLTHRKQVLQREPPTHRCFYTQKLLYGEVFTQRNLHTELKCLRVAKGSPTAAALWPPLGPANGTRQRDPPTGQRGMPTGQRDNGTTGQRDRPNNGTTGQPDNGTMGQGDNGTMGQQERAHETRVRETTFEWCIGFDK